LSRSATHQSPQYGALHFVITHPTHTTHT